jgi:peptidoglycan/LPS O-acetylase OafA/YrhL
LSRSITAGPQQSVPASDPALAAAPGTTTPVRHDIQALRALAVASVVLFHLWPNILPAGYVGVDVFFVISGYLITSHLVKESTRPEGLKLGTFWARRAKRLLPAAFTVLLVTTVATFLIVPAARWQQFFSETVASTLYVENWLLAANSVDYLAADNPASPVQHFWTLSVEEQFYLVIPLLLLAAVWLARMTRSSRRVLIASVLALVTAGSFAYSMWLTNTAAPSAYFSTFTRAWEFGVGALLAFLASPTNRWSSRLMAWPGLAMIVTACFIFSSTTPFPGYAAALPVLGTAAVILGRDNDGLVSVNRLGSWRPVAFLGAISYSLYLWHWPLIVLLPFATGEALTRSQKVGIIVAALVLAYLSTRFIETPMRFSPRLLGGSRRPRTVAAWSVVGMLLVSGIAVSGIRINDVQQTAQAQQTARVIAEKPHCLGAASMVPSRTPCVDPELAGVLIPNPDMAAADMGNSPACWAGSGDSTLNVCPLGPAHGYTKRLFAVGDSHSNALLAAYRVIATTHHWRIDVAGHNGCYWTAAVQFKPVSAYITACQAWKVNVNQYLASQPPYDGILVTYASGRSQVMTNGSSQQVTIVDGLHAEWHKQIARGTPVIAISDNPFMRTDIVDCVAKYGLSATTNCASARATALSNFNGLAAAVKQTPGSTYLDLTNFFCTHEVCEPVIGHVVVYRDVDHITATYSRTLGPYLGAAIAHRMKW